MLSLNKEGKSQHDDEEPRGAAQNGNQPPTRPCDYWRHARDDLAGPLLFEFDRLGCRWSSNSGACAPARGWGEEYPGHACRDASLHGSCDVEQSTSAGSLAGQGARTSSNLPIFDPRTTPTARGAICETFRTWPNTLRSNHPVESVCARGVAASTIVSEHPLAFSEGRGGPFEKLYDLDCWVLLLGVGFNRCTALHFAESLLDKRRVKTVRFPVVDNGQRVWTEVLNVGDDNDTHFPVIGHKYVSTEGVRQGTIGDAQSMLFPMRGLVDFAVSYFHHVL